MRARTWGWSSPPRSACGSWSGPWVPSGSSRTGRSCSGAEIGASGSPSGRVPAPSRGRLRRVGKAVEELNRERELALVRELTEAIGSEAGAALGPQEVLEALSQGRVRHVLFDADRDYGGRPLAARLMGDGESELPVAERMIEL